MDASNIMTRSPASLRSLSQPAHSLPDSGILKMAGSPRLRGIHTLHGEGEATQRCCQPLRQFTNKNAATERRWSVYTSARTSAGALPLAPLDPAGACRGKNGLKERLEPLMAGCPLPSQTGLLPRLSLQRWFELQKHFAQLSL